QLNGAKIGSCKIRYLLNWIISISVEIQRRAAMIVEICAREPGEIVISVRDVCGVREGNLRDERQALRVIRIAKRASRRNHACQPLCCVESKLICPTTGWLLKAQARSQPIYVVVREGVACEWPILRQQLIAGCITERCCADAVH